MDRFVYNSKEFRDELAKSPHHAGEVAFLQSIARPGMRAIDAGANKGVTAIALAGQVGEAGHVYAFEPVPEYYAHLTENLSRNSLANVSPHRLALSNRVGRIRFYKHGGGSGITAADDAEMIWVQATTLAQFFADQKIGRIDLLNLDCEGSELLVFQGAKAILAAQTPRIFCEVHRGYLKRLGQSGTDVVTFLTKIGYDVQPLQVEDLRAEASFENCTHIYAARRAGSEPVRSLNSGAAERRGGTSARPLGAGGRRDILAK